MLRIMFNNIKTLRVYNSFWRSSSGYNDTELLQNCYLISAMHKRVMKYLLERTFIHQIRLKQLVFTCSKLTIETMF